jgi:hypothetical protein
MLIFTESFAITLLSIVLSNQFSSVMLLPSIIYRIYYVINLSSPNIWILFTNAVLCTTGSICQEIMIRNIKKRFGYVSIFIFAITTPLTYYNILFSDPAPYFTLCIYGCFAVEDCFTSGLSWGKFVSLTTVFGLAFQLTAEVLAISFSFRFIRLSPEDITTLVTEVRITYGNHVHHHHHDDDDDDDKEENEADKTKAKNEAKEKSADLFSMNEENGRKNEGNGIDIINSLKTGADEKHNESFRSEFMKVQFTMKPIRYNK